MKIKKVILNNPEQFPTLDVLQSVMGENFENYKQLLSFFEQQNLFAEWRYYNDGKSWLCKVQFKKKTVCWLSVWEDCFKLSFYFTEKHLENIAKLAINEKTKEDFFSTKQVGRLLSMVISIDTLCVAYLQSDIEKVIIFKMKLK